MVAPQQTPAQKILIVDDDLDTLKLVGTTLEKQGFIIIAAKDGPDALAKVAEHQPDLIVLDIMMPKMDGYEVTRRLRADSATAALPIILFTAKGQVQDKVAGLDMGADEYITKPTHPAELIARVRSLLARKSTPPKRQRAVSTSLATVVGVIAGKGGQGVSTLAVNLAAGFQSVFKGVPVVLAEFRPGRGDIGVQLGFADPQGLNRLLKKNEQEIHRADVESALVNHKSGLRLLLSSFDPTDVNLMSRTNQIAAILRELAQVSPYCVLDLGVGLYDGIQSALDHCSKLIVVVEPDPHSVVRTTALLEGLKKIDFPSEDILAVLVHRVRTDLAMSASDMQKAIGMKISAVFTPATELAFQASEQHQTMVAMQPDSYTAQQTIGLVKMITEPVQA